RSRPVLPVLANKDGWCRGVGCLLLDGGQRKVERRAAFRPVGDPDASAMRLDCELAERQAQPGAFCAALTLSRIALEEAFKHPLMQLRRDALARVHDAHHLLTVLLPDVDAHLAAGGRIA